MMHLVDRIHTWFDLESGELIIICTMCMLAVLFVKIILQNVGLAIVFYPLLVVSSVISVGLGRDFGLVGEWTHDTVKFLIASGCGMSIVALVVLFFVAVANHRA